MAERSGQQRAGDKRQASKRVADELQSQIEAGRLVAGASLPPYRQLAEEFGVAVNTTMAAVRILRDRGVVTIRRHAKAVVRDPASSMDVLTELAEVSRELDDIRSALLSATERLKAAERKLTGVAEVVGEGSA